MSREATVVNISGGEWAEECRSEVVDLEAQSVPEV